MRRRLGAAFLLAVLLCLVLTWPVAAQGGVPVPQISLGVSGSKRPEDVSVTMQLLALLTVLSVAPGILMMTTAFTRIIIVLSLTRSALGTQQIPPNQVLMGLALCLTFFTMQPTLSEFRRLATFLCASSFGDAAARRRVRLGGEAAR